MHTCKLCSSIEKKAIVVSESPFFEAILLAIQEDFSTDGTALFCLLNLRQFCTTTLAGAQVDLLDALLPLV